MEPTCETLERRFDYEDGTLFWKDPPSNRVKVGQPAGCLSSNGYHYTRVDSKLYLTHRLIFKMHHGYCPEYVDHEDQDTMNNCIGNLRSCSKSENGCNSKISVNNKSGVKGVYLDKRCGQWVAEIKKDGIKHYLGTYIYIEAAALAVTEARLRLHEEFACNGL